MARNKAEVCAHCGRPGPLLCEKCRCGGHEGGSMFSCNRCVKDWRTIDARIAKVCDRQPSVPARLLDGVVLVS